MADLKDPLPPDRGLIGVFTSDAILELDITEALQSIGCSVVAVHDYDPDRIDIAGPGKISAAVIDLKADHAHADRSVSELTRRLVPTVVIVSEDSQMQDISQRPGVVGCFRKPVIIDHILPGIAAVTETEWHGTPPIPEQPTRGQAS